MSYIELFSELRSILKPFSNDLVVVRDEEGDYYLDTPHIMKNSKPLYFGSVKICKNYVSYHLMPVYVFPELLQNISKELHKRMQGKSCFNFKRIDPLWISELETLTRKGYDKYKAAGYL